MSCSNQNNTKKSGSSNSSMVNTPASTPVTTMANGQTTTQTSPPPNTAPKFGTLVPNRIFVGGISANTTEGELLQLFSNYGTVKAAKIIQDRAGVSKGYGFITFESEDDAKRLQREADNIVLRERKLNIAPAIKKQPFSRAFDASSPPAVAPGNPAQYFFQPGTMPYFQGGVAYYPQPPTAPADPTTQQPAVYQPPSVYSQPSAQPQTAAYPPVMFPAQPIYMPQQYPMHMPYEYNYYTNGGAQYMVGGQSGPQSQITAIQQRPNSPPRPACYAQLPSYSNPNEAMYYNMPIYGPVDGTMYADPTAVDMSMSNGTLPEESYLPQDACEISQQSTTNIKQIAIINKDASLDGGKLDMAQIETHRQSNTPVISVLSLDQHQEKDLVSMQSGRRRKTIPNSSPHDHTHHFANNATNGYPTSFANYNTSSYGYLPGPTCATNFGYQFAPPNNSSSHPITNGFDKSYGNSLHRKGRNYDNRRSAETSSMSSIRTDSNSSASVVDENRNEEKSQYSTSPPSTTTPYNNINKYHTRNFQNSVRPSRGNYDMRRSNFNPNKYNHSNASRDYNYMRPNRDPNQQKPPHFTYNNSFANKPPISPIPQMHVGSQHFVPPQRRNRKTVRRSGSSALSEIGAGDAPLPNADVSEACNKLDSLKL